MGEAVNVYANACKTERIKVFSTRVWWGLALVMVVYVGFTAVTMAAVEMSMGEFGAEAATQEIVVPPRAIYTLGSSMGYIFPLMLGALSVTGEWRHKTITPTFTAAGARGPVLAGKIAVQFLVGLLYGAIALAAAVLASVFLLAPDTGLDSAETWLTLLRSFTAMGLWATVGVGLGLLVRNQTGAILIVIGFTQFLEPVLRMVAPFNDFLNSAVRFFPGATADAYVGDSLYLAMTSGLGGSPTLTWWQGGIGLVAYATVFLVLGYFLRWRTADVT